jgi:8-oxo-dGTP pyrophosphatase MutT (NUDIX family)
LLLSRSELDGLREWAEEGTALTAAARVTDPDGRLALVRNRWSDGWLLPGGAVEVGETPRAAARREVSEETGLDATVGDPLVVFEQSYVREADGEERFAAAYLVFEATAAGDIPPVDELGVDADEIAAARWFESPPENLHDGELLRRYL